MMPAALQTAAPWWRKLLQSIAPPAPPPRGRRPYRLAYDGATTSNRVGTWSPTSRSANSEVRSAGNKLRNRSRDLVRNVPEAARALDVKTAYIVGEGIRPMCNVRPAADTDEAREQAQRINRAVDELWRAWGKVCDSDGQLTFAAMQTLAVRSWLESGEVIIRKRPRRMSDGLPVPLQLQMLEADHIAGGEIGTMKGDNEVISGVEVDKIGRRVAYWLYRTHPGDSFLMRSVLSTDAVRVDARDVIHMYTAERPGQVRGVPWCAPAIVSIRDIDDFVAAELTRKKIETCMVATVNVEDNAYGTDYETSEEGLVRPSANSDGDLIETIEPGMIAINRGGKSVDIHEPKAVPNFGEWMDVMQHRVCTALGVPYELVTGDLSKVNFSSFRRGENVFRRKCDVERSQIVVPLFCDRVWRWFIDAAVASGTLPPRPGGYPVKWSRPRYDAMDPVKDAKAKADSLANGLTDLRSVLAGDGVDMDEALQEMATTQQTLERLGLRFAWQEKPAPAQAPPADPEADPEPTTDDA